MFIRKRHLEALLQVAYTAGYVKAQFDQKQPKSEGEIRVPPDFLEQQRRQGWQQ